MLSQREESIFKRDFNHGQDRVLLARFRSVIVHLITPGGDCIDAVPFFAEKSALIKTRLSGALC